MKLAIHRAVDTRGLGEESGFRIQANAKAFQALSSTLYSDKIAAVLRELGCNAQDSHKAAGIRRPIVVKLPNAINPEFYIQDFGIGMSHAQVKGLYTTYFASTKDDSNDEVGAFGLGSKSPFAYTDSFTVETVKRGVHRVYGVFIGPSGNPRIASVDRRRATKNWASGVKIGFMVQPHDVQQFQDKALEVFQWFDPLPKLLGVEERPQPPVLRFRSTRLGIATVQRPTNRVYVVMGGVQYPVPDDLLKQMDTPALGPSAKPQPFFNLGYDKVAYLFAEIGEVEVAISRETLSYTKTSIAGLKKLAESARAEVLQLVDDVLSGPGTLLEQFNAWHQNQSGNLDVAMSVFPDTDHAAKTRLVWKGEWLPELFPDLGNPLRFFRQKVNTASGYQVQIDTSSGREFWAKPTYGSSTVMAGILAVLDKDLTEAGIRARVRTVLRDQPDGTRVWVFRHGSELESAAKRLGIPAIPLSGISPVKDQITGEPKMDRSLAVATLKLDPPAGKIDIHQGFSTRWAHYGLAFSKPGAGSRLDLDKEAPGIFYYPDTAVLQNLRSYGYGNSSFLPYLNLVLEGRLGRKPVEKLPAVSSERSAKLLREAGWQNLKDVLQQGPAPKLDPAWSRLALLGNWFGLPNTVPTVPISIAVAWLHLPELRKQLASSLIGQAICSEIGMDPDLTGLCLESLHTGLLREVTQGPTPYHRVHWAEAFTARHPFVGQAPGLNTAPLTSGKPLEARHYMRWVDLARTVAAID
ncbi:ATP-binding protein [Thiomonas sp.]